MNQPRRLELAVRRNHGRRMCAEWRAGLAAILGRSASTIKTTSLETVDAALASMEVRLANPPSESDIAFVASDVREVAHRLTSLTGDVSNREMYLLHRDSEYCGAVITTLREILDRAAELIPVEGDDVVAQSPDGLVGLVIDYVSEPPQYTPEFVVRFWLDA